MDDIVLSFRWGGKDGKWRWLVEVGPHAQAGEERHLDHAMRVAESVALELQSRSSRSSTPSDVSPTKIASGVSSSSPEC